MLILNVKWLLTWQASSPVIRDQPLKSGPEIKPRQISSFAYTKPIVKRFPVSGGGIFCGSCVACPTASNGASQWRWVPVTHGFYRHPVWLVPNMELVLKSNLGCDCLHLIQNGGHQLSRLKATLAGKRIRSCARNATNPTQMPGIDKVEPPPPSPPPSPSHCYFT